MPAPAPRVAAQPMYSCDSECAAKSASQTESLRDKAFSKFNNSLLVRAQEYIDNFPGHVENREGPFYLPIPAEVLLSEAERPKFQAMYEVVAEGSWRLRAP